MSERSPEAPPASADGPLPAGGPLLSAGRAFLLAEGWPAVDAGEPGSLWTTFSGKAEFACLLHAREAEHQLLFYSYWPDTVPPAERALAAEYLTRVNFGMPVGNFELDLSDGTIRYKTSLATEGGPVGVELLRPLVFANAFVMDQYATSIAEVIAHTRVPIDTATRLGEFLARREAARRPALPASD